MKVKKFLQKKAEEDLKSLETDSDRKFLQRLKNMAGERMKPSRKKKEKL